MQPRRRIPGWVVWSAVAGAIGAIILNIAATRIDSELVSRYGNGYPMQFTFAAAAWPYFGYLVAVAGIVGVWWWSQSAPPPPAPEIIERIEYRDPPPPEPIPPRPFTEWAGVRWEFEQGRAQPHCPNHPDTRLLIDASNDGVDEFLTAIPRHRIRFADTSSWRLYCSDDGFVRLGGQEGYDFYASELYDAQQVADQRLRAEYRRLRAAK